MEPRASTDLSDRQEGSDFPQVRLCRLDLNIQTFQASERRGSRTTPLLDAKQHPFGIEGLLRINTNSQNKQYRRVRPAPVYVKLH